MRFRVGDTVLAARDIGGLLSPAVAAGTLGAVVRIERYGGIVVRFADGCIHEVAITLLSPVTIRAHPVPGRSARIAAAPGASVVLKLRSPPVADADDARRT